MARWCHGGLMERFFGRSLLAICHAVDTRLICCCWDRNPTGIIEFRVNLFRHDVLRTIFWSEQYRFRVFKRIEKCGFYFLMNRLGTIIFNTLAAHEWPPSRHLPLLTVARRAAGECMVNTQCTHVPLTVQPVSPADFRPLPAQLEVIMASTGAF